METNILTFDRHISAAACTTNIDILRLNLGTEISNVSKYLSQFSLWLPPNIKLSHVLVFAVFDGAHTAVFSSFRAANKRNGTACELGDVMLDRLDLFHHLVDVVAHLKKEVYDIRSKETGNASIISLCLRTTNVFSPGYSCLTLLHCSLAPHWYRSRFLCFHSYQARSFLQARDYRKLTHLS